MTIEHLDTHVPYVCICTHVHMYVYDGMRTLACVGILLALCTHLWLSAYGVALVSRID